MSWEEEASLNYVGYEDTQQGQSPVRMNEQFTKRLEQGGPVGPCRPDKDLGFNLPHDQRRAVL